MAVKVEDEVFARFELKYVLSVIAVGFCKGLIVGYAWFEANVFAFCWCNKCKMNKLFSIGFSLSNFNDKLVSMGIFGFKL